MMSFSVVMWEIGIGAVVVTRVACFLRIVIYHFLSHVNKSHTQKNKKQYTKQYYYIANNNNITQKQSDKVTLVILYSP